MKRHLFLFTFLFPTTLYAQEHNSDTAFLINKQTFKIQAREINPDQVTLTILRNSKVINVDTLDAQEVFLISSFLTLTKMGTRILC